MSTRFTMLGASIILVGVGLLAGGGRTQAATTGPQIWAMTAAGSSGTLLMVSGSGMPSGAISMTWDGAPVTCAAYTNSLHAFITQCMVTNATSAGTHTLAVRDGNGTVTTVTVTQAAFTSYAPAVASTGAQPHAVTSATAVYAAPTAHSLWQIRME